MRYTDEQVELYLHFLNPDTIRNQERKKPEEVRRNNCQGEHFIVKSGYNICEECGVSQGHALGFFDQREYERFHFRQQSIYQRKYHYEKKIADISKKVPPIEEQKYCLYKNLMEIDRDKMDVLNKRFCRKRINIFYLIKKFSQEMGNENYKLIDFKISCQTLENYEEWWRCYKNL